MTVIHTKTGKAPLPKGWALEEAIEVLREVGHTITNITTDGEVVTIPETEMRMTS
mgnify:CR=1 FL=1